MLLFQQVLLQSHDDWTASLLQKKICLLGSYAVGKTSIVNQYVSGVFSDDYKNTLKIDVLKQVVPIKGTDVTLLLWDLPGDHGISTVLPTYLRGMAGYILVVDPSRKSTLNSAVNMHKLVFDVVGPKPFVLVFNKNDIKDCWKPISDEFKSLRNNAIAVLETSAKSGECIDLVFEAIAQTFIEQNDNRDYGT